MNRHLTPRPLQRRGCQLPYYAGSGAFGVWNVYRRFNGFVKHVVSCQSEREARDTAYKWNGKWMKEQKQ